MTVLMNPKRTRLQIDTEPELKAAVKYLADLNHNGSISDCINEILRDHLAPVLKALRQVGVRDGDGDGEGSGPDRPTKRR